MGIYYWAVSESSSPDVYNVLTKDYETVIRAIVFLYVYANFYASFSPLFLIISSCCLLYF